MSYTAQAAGNRPRRLLRLLIVVLAICGTLLTPLAGTAHVARGQSALAGSLPLARTSGATAALVVAYRGDVAPVLLNSANLRTLGVRFRNVARVSGKGRIVPLPVLLLGTRAVPTIRVALTQIKREHPVRLYLLGMQHTQRLTLVANTLFDGLSVYINKQPGRVTTLAGLTVAIGKAALFRPRIARHGSGVRLLNAAEVDAETPVSPPPGPVYAAYELPSAFLPPVGDQGAEGSCVGWSTSYYYRTFLEAKKYGWSPADPNHIFSPSFVYNQINGGEDDGSSIANAMSLITQVGDVPITLFPYTAGDYTTQPASQVVQAAMAYHIADFGYLYSRALQQVPPDLNKLKRWLSTGDGLVIGAHIPEPSFSDYQGGVYDGPYQDDSKLEGHAMFVVGYDDNAEGTGIGAFRIINSWSPSWGESGYIWLSYAYFSQYVDEAWVMLDTPPASPTPSATLAPQSTATATATATAAPRPTSTPAPAPQSLLYGASGAYTLHPNPAGHNFTAVLTFTFTATNSSGATVERDQPVYRVTVAPNSDTVYTLHYTMHDGTVATAQVEVQAGAYPG